MMLSIFYLLLLLAAGSKASPCKPSSGNWTWSSGTGGSDTIHRDGQGSGAAKGNQKLGVQGKAALNLVSSSSQASAPQTNNSALNTGSNGATSGSSGSSGTSGSGSGTSDTSGSLTPASGTCPPGFLNTVFNTGAGQASGFPSTTWDTLTKHGISNWIGFSLKTLDQQTDYNLSPTQGSQLSGAFNKAQIPIVMDHTYINDAVTMLANNTPPYLELFNEPDYSFENLTLTEDAGPSAADLKKLFDTPHPNTTYISPALANANSDWLTTFFQACNNCIDQIDVIAMHIYNPDPKGVIDLITQLHNTWGKTIWITELSPAAAGCTLDPTSMANYTNTLIPMILKLGYVEKIFWNSGEPDSPAINSAPAPCNPSLTNADGSATAVLQALGAACGITPGGTATS